ncbi:Histone-fold [Pseudocohnilembus persalinus]|uniref:Histone-fold n=1 Tax=Pseudocohnilembus persalinus TaxID=266149 RepID=A0A0V0QD65_PSEPJ|nr:Histone-fold [Pseudocohnilembus persalinus]|eukprot:KRX00142.1 Histone-fold [Pseudocohnilembus persalinus]
MGDVKQSSEYQDLVLQLCREYITIISDMANTICLKEGKKTIAPDFIYKALTQFNLEEQIPELKKSQIEIQEQIQEQKKKKEMFRDEQFMNQCSYEQTELYKKLSMDYTEDAKEDNQTQEEKEEKQLQNLVNNTEAPSVKQKNVFQQQDSEEEDFECEDD